MKWFLNICIIPTLSLALQSDFEIENTNIFVKEDSKKFSDYNRLRVYSYIYDEKYENFLFNLIFDNNNNYSVQNKNDTKIYRAYLKYSDEKQIVTLGKQRIPFGVGRIWNPIDIYNPIDATSIEIDERKGTDSLRYEYSINNLTSFDATISKNKYAIRLKTNRIDTDIALVLLKDEDKNNIITGYELAGELLDTGIELRSEGGYFYNQKDEKNYSEFIIGAEKYFETPLSILGEYKHNTLNNSDYLALNFFYDLSALWNCSYLLIANINDKSSVNMLKFDYSLSDEMELNFGTYIYGGNSSSQYGSLDNSFFVRYFVHF